MPSTVSQKVTTGQMLDLELLEKSSGVQVNVCVCVCVVVCRCAGECVWLCVGLQMSGVCR